MSASSGLPPFLDAVLVAGERSKVRPRAPGFVAPMLAASRRGPLPTAGWIHERTVDGERVVVVRDERGAHLWTRDGVDVTRGHADLAVAVHAGVPPGVVADGVVWCRDGHPHLSLFDAPTVGGHDVTGLPLRTRKRLIDLVTEVSGPVSVAPHREACRGPAPDGGRGFVARRARSPYRPGVRSADWLVIRPDRLRHT